jgi:hypothetical protein
VTYDAGACIFSPVQLYDFHSKPRNPANCSGYVPINTVAKTVKELVAKYPTFGGVADWEYFNTLPGGLQNPVKWGAIMSKAMGN